MRHPGTLMRRASGSPEPLALEVREFVARVIYDGRFVADFHERPHEVARRLDVPLSAGSAKAIESLPPGDLLAAAGDLLTENVSRRQLGKEPVSPMALNLVVILVIIFVLIPAPLDVVRDHSADAALKL